MRDPRPEKLRAEEPASSPLPFKEVEEDAKLDDVMMAMDVVDTLRHERMLVVRDVNAVERRESLVDRLRGIYKGQGIEVPDDILLDGVRALEEERFRYAPPRKSLGTTLAMAYINRGRWLPFAGTLLALVALAGGLSAAWAVTDSLEETRIERALDVLPGELSDARDTALDLAADANARDVVDAVHGDGVSALSASDVVGAQAALDRLGSLTRELDLAYDVTAVSRPGELSVVEREAETGGFNHYIVVEAITPSGQTVERDILNEETGEVERVDIWAQRVDRATYDRAYADKAGNGILEMRDVGSKDRGTLEVDYTTGDYSGVQDGAITDWSGRLR